MSMGLTKYAAQHFVAFCALLYVRYAQTPLEAENQFNLAGKPRHVAHR